MKLSWPDTVVLLGVGLFFILAPSFDIIPAVAERYDDKRIVEIAIVAGCCFFILFNRHLRGRLADIASLFPLPTRIILIILIMLGAVSSLLARAVDYAFLELSLFLGLFIFALHIASISLNHATIFKYSLLTIVLISAIVYETTFYSGYVASFVENIPLKWPEPFSGFSSVRFFNQYQAWTLPLITLPLLLCSALDRRIRAFIAAIAVAWITMLFASGSRGAVGAYISALVITALVFRAAARAFLKTNLLVLISGWMSYLILFFLMPDLFGKKVLRGWRPVERLAEMDDRLSLWKTALGYIREHPWLGIGPMHYACYPNTIAAHPHNSILQWTAEFGIPSAILLTILVSWGLVSWIRRFYTRQHEPGNGRPLDATWIALFCSLSTALIYSMVSGVIVMPMSQTMMAVVGGWILGLYFKSKGISLSRKVPDLRAHAGIQLAAGIVLVVLAYTVTPDLAPRLTGQNEFIFISYQTLGPRFWQFNGMSHCVF